MLSRVISFAALLAVLCTASLSMHALFAQQPAAPQAYRQSEAAHAPPPPVNQARERPDFARDLAISPEKAAQVEAILKEGRDQARAAHERSHARLAQLLTPEQLAKLEEMMPRPPQRPGQGQWTNQGGPPRQ